MLLFAFIEGALVLVLEILGARTIAPYFGTTHVVWTAQITATLAALAIGYGLGGRWSAAETPRRLTRALSLSALWLAAAVSLRAPIMSWSGEHLGIAAGSFACAGLIFGPPLAALGAVGPLLVERLHGGSRSAGSASGATLLTSTVGGLVGGWLAALAIVPHVSVATALFASAVSLALLAAVWTRSLGRAPSASLATAGACALIGFAAPAAPTSIGPEGARASVLSSEQGPTGLVQVLELEGADARYLLVDGTVQGAARLSSGESVVEFSDSLWRAGLACRPGARNALVVGLGAGTLARSLAARGVSPVVVEIDPAVVRAARRHFGLPSSVDVLVDDARTAIRRERREFDLVLLDVYRGESFPWHLATVEAFAEMRRRLSPGGCLVVNGIARAGGRAEGLARIEAGLATAFSDVHVFFGSDGGELENATLVAADHPLRAAAFPFGRSRRADRSVAPTRDDLSDLDLADAELRLAWRKTLLAELDPRALTP